MTQLVPVPFDKAVHERSYFDSGEPSLNRWLQDQASQSQRKDAARTYVACDDQLRIIGYYSLCMFSVGSRDAPPPVRIGVYPIPAVLLARLAVDRRHQQRGLGSGLLLNALLLAARASEAIAARMMVVHAIDKDAAGYYRSHGFKPFDAHPLTLYLPMQDIRKTLKVAGLLCFVGTRRSLSFVRHHAPSDRS